MTTLVREDDRKRTRQKRENERVNKATNASFSINHIRYIMFKERRNGIN